MNRFVVRLVVPLAVLATALVAPLQAQTTPAPASRPPAPAASGQPSQVAMTQDQLDSLVAPIALYPDKLLVQTLMASTYPLDVVEASRFVKANKELKGDAMVKAAEQKNWDPSVQSLTAYPQVLEMMNDKLEWMQQLGDAVLADEAKVMETVQKLRKKASDAGNLKSSEQQKVVVQEKVIVIEPAQPQTVYVPTYNPAVVYGTWWAPTYPPYYWPPPAYYYPGYAYGAAAVGFGVGLAVGAAWGWAGANWGGNDINIDVNNNFVRNNNNAEFKNRAQNGKFDHNPSQRKGVAYRDQGTRDKFAATDRQQQRVALARALVLEPAVLLFDEPLSNLDARLRREMREEIRQLQQRLQLTVAYVTHDQSEALAVSDHIIVMDQGGIAQRGTPQELYEAPASAFVAGFMGEATLFPARADGSGAVTLGPLRIAPRWPVPAGAVKVAVRPESWHVGPPGHGLNGRLAKLSYLGSSYEYTFETELGPVFVVSGDMAQVLSIGSDVGLQLASHGVAVVQDA